VPSVPSALNRLMRLPQRACLLRYTAPFRTTFAICIVIIIVLRIQQQILRGFKTWELTSTSAKSCKFWIVVVCRIHIISPFKILGVNLGYWIEYCFVSRRISAPREWKLPSMTSGGHGRGYWVLHIPWIAACIEFFETTLWTHNRTF